MACARSATCSLVKVLGQERVAKREPEKAERDASPSIGAEQEREEREVRDEQHTNPAWQHPRSQGGYAQRREPHEPAEDPRDEDRAEDGLAERVLGDDRDHGDRTQERRPQKGHYEARLSQPSVT